MSKTPFMPLWVSDFLGDTLDLDAAEIGAYMLLLMAQWNRNGDSLPNDTKKLQRVARCGRNWPKIWGNIQRYFDEDDNGVYSKRLRLEAQNVASKREVNAHNGSLGGKAKALKTNNVHLANATNSPERNPAIPEPEPYIETDTNVSVVKQPQPVDEISEAIQHFNAVAVQSGWPKVVKASQARRSAVKARIKDAGGLSEWMGFIDRAAKSSFLTGNNENGWVADFDFFGRPAKFTSLIEGKYDDRRPNRNSGDDFHSQVSAALGGNTDGPQRTDQIDNIGTKRLSAPFQSR